MHFSIPDTQEFICDRTGSNFTVSLVVQYHLPFVRDIGYCWFALCTASWIYLLTIWFGSWFTATSALTAQFRTTQNKIRHKEYANAWFDVAKVNENEHEHGNSLCRNCNANRAPSWITLLCGTHSRTSNVSGFLLNERITCRTQSEAESDKTLICYFQF